MNAHERAANALRGHFGEAPSTAIVLGSGLGVLADRAAKLQRQDYEALGLPPTGVAGHAGNVAVGELGGRRVALLSGRVHLYEGRPLDEVVLAVRAMARWGVRRVVLTNAAGGIEAGFRPGDVMLVEDHINLMGTSPLIGPDNGLGPRFPDMTEAYDPTLRAEALRVAAELGVPLHRGVYVAMHGPAYETPAEIRMVRTLGAQAVGMSTVPEVLALRQLGVPTMAFSLISNVAAGLGNAPLHHDEVTDAAARAGDTLGRVLETLVARWS